MSRAYNFCAGPAALPEAVLQRAREEMLDYRGTGMSVMEVSHRDDVIVAMAEQAGPRACDLNRGGERRDTRMNRFQAQLSTADKRAKPLKCIEFADFVQAL